MKKFYLMLSQALVAMLLFSSHLAAQQADYKDFKPLVIKNAARLGISTTDAENAIITSAHTDERTHVTFVYMQQAYQQIKVYGTIISAAFIDGNLQYSSGTFVKDIATKAGSIIPGTTAASAIEVAANYLGLSTPGALSVASDRFPTAKTISFTPGNISRQNIDVTLYWTPSDDKQTVRLTWNVNIDVKGSTDWWNVRIDAQTGTYVQKDNWTVDEHTPDLNVADEAITTSVNTGFKQKTQITTKKGIASKKSTIIKKPTTAPQIILQSPPPNVTSATYRVIRFPYESPIHTTFTNEVSPWLMAGAGNNATTLGWHFDSVANYNITRGNNVFAYLDKTATNAPDAITNWPDTSSTAAPSLTFVNNANLSLNPDSVSVNKKAALDNLFYWNNLMHDVMYQYGLTEAAGNFQRQNLGRGGAGNDWVNAQAQDGAGTNNANFSTPTDGGNGRMRMYLFSGALTFTVNSPGTIAGNYAALESNFSTANKLKTVGPITGEVVLYVDSNATTNLACVSAANASQLNGKIALIYSPTCAYTIKVKNAQNAGAKAVIVYRAVDPAVTMGGADNTITIPAINIGTTVATPILNQLNAGNPVNVTMRIAPDLDGDLDNGVVTHEYGHGVSNRLTGGPYGSGCLGNAEQGGEGWSDYLALMMTTNWNTATVNDGTLARPVGTYVSAQATTGGGIRRYPYSTNLSVNPLTYANMATSTEVHNIGEIWCSTVWDMTWNIIQQVGSITPNLYNSAGTGGNVIALNLVMTGLKLQPCYPGYIDARNAILAADSILYGNAHKCAIWAAFARRGMGYSASQGLSTSATDQTVAYDLPGGVQITKNLPLTVSPNGQMTLTRTATCDCQPATYTLRDTIPTGFTYISSSPAGTLNGNVLSFPATAFTSTQSKTFAITLRAPAVGCTIDTVINDNRDNATSGGFVSSGNGAWIPSTLKSHTPATSWFANNGVVTNAAVTTSILTSSATAAPALKTLSILSFWHNFRTETYYDGGVVEYSLDGGSTWTDAGSLFLGNGYNTTMITGSPFAGKRAFSGNNKTFVPVMLNASSFGTAPVAFRFRLASDTLDGVEGWYIDDIIRANGCGAIMSSGIYDVNGTRKDTASVPVFVTPNPLPLTLLSFYANPVGSQVALDWKTATEVNVKDYTIEWSADGINWNSLGSQLAQNRTSNSYSFMHNNPVTGKNYYRIKMNDVDGKFTYSPVRVVSFKDKQPALVLLPNPVNTESVLYLSKDLKATNVKVYDAAGSLVRQIAVGAGIQQVKIETVNLAAGVYTVEANGSSRQIIRMMVQH